MVKNGEKKERRLEIKLPHSLFNRLLQYQIEEIKKTKKKLSIGYLIREAIRKVYSQGGT